MLSFAWIWMFLALPLPFFVRLWSPKSDEKPLSLKIPHFDTVLSAGRSRMGSSTSLMLLTWLIWILLIIATARPIWIERSAEIPATGRDMIVAIDASGSMRHADFAQSSDSRFTIVQDIAGAFIERRTGDRVGLIIFGTQPYLHAPLTFDTKTVAQFLNETVVGMAGQRTAIGDTIAMAVKVLRERPASSRVLVLLTDGANTDGYLDPIQATQLAVRYGVRVYAIGIGQDLELMGSQTSRRGTSGNTNDLEYIAEVTGGAYFHALDPDTLRGVYHQIEQFEPIAIDDRRFLLAKELYFYPLALALTIFLFLVFLRWSGNTELLPKFLRPSQDAIH